MARFIRLQANKERILCHHAAIVRIEANQAQHISHHAFMRPNVFQSFQS